MSTTTPTPGAEPIPTPEPTAPVVPDRRPDPQAPAARSSDRLYRLSVAQYQQMVEADILTRDDRIELIEGLLVEKMSRKPRHVNTTRLIVRAFDRSLPEGWFAAKEDPASFARSVPEPDVAVLRGRVEDYFDRLAGLGDIALLVEVADSSYGDDSRKRRIYAEGAVPHFWIANLNADRIEAYSDPTGPDPSPDYRLRKDHAMGEQIPLIVDGREVARLAVSDLLAPPPRPEG